MIPHRVARLIRIGIALISVRIVNVVRSKRHIQIEEIDQRWEVGGIEMCYANAAVHEAQAMQLE